MPVGPWVTTITAKPVANWHKTPRRSATIYDTIITKLPANDFNARREFGFSTGQNICCD
jgi:hypothetical protein